MRCPNHPEVELRRENYYATGICPKCTRPFRMCTSVQFMSLCDRIEGHEGPHKDGQGREWK